MERQLKECLNTSKKEVNVGTDVINDLVLFFHDQLDHLDFRIEKTLVEILFKRCNAMLLCHHEYRKLNHHQKSYLPISDTISGNFTKALALLLAYMDTLDPLQQLQFVFSDHDIELCLPLINQSSTKKVCMIKENF